MIPAVYASIPNILLVPFVMLSFMWYAYGPKYTSKVYYVSAYAVYVAVFAGVSFGISNYALNFITSFLVFCAISILLFKPSPRKIIYNLVFHMYLSIVDVVSVPFFALLSGHTIEELLPQFHLRLLALSTSLVILLVTYRPITRVLVRRQLEEMSLRQTIFMAALAVSQLVSMALFTVSSERMYEILFIVILALYFFIDIYTVFLLESMSKHNRLQREQALEAQRADMMKTYYEGIQARYESSRKALHDMKNHISAMESLSERAKDYARMLMQDMDALGYSFQSTDPVLAVVVNDKLALAKTKGIELALSIEDVSFAFMRDIDTTSLLANLFDNTIEAVEELPEGRRAAEVTIRNVHHHITLCFANPYAGTLLRDGRVFRSTKGEHRGHGVGNVQRVVESYDGHMEIQAENNAFVVNIVIPVPVPGGECLS